MWNGCGPVYTYPVNLIYQKLGIIRICCLQYCGLKKIKAWGKVASLAVIMFRNFIGLFCCKERDLDIGALRRYVKAFPFELLQHHRFPRLVILINSDICVLNQFNRYSVNLASMGSIPWFVLAARSRRCFQPLYMCMSDHDHRATVHRGDGGLGLHWKSSLKTHFGCVSVFSDCHAMVVLVTHW